MLALYPIIVIVVRMISDDLRFIQLGLTDVWRLSDCSVHFCTSHCQLDWDTGTPAFRTYGKLGRQRSCIAACSIPGLDKSNKKSNNKLEPTKG